MNKAIKVRTTPEEVETKGMETIYKIASIIAATVGRKLHTYDSWNGSSMTITVEDAEQLTDSVKFTGPNAWGGKSGIYVHNNCIVSLVLTGKAERYSTVDHCDVVERYELN